MQNSSRLGASAAAPSHYVAGVGRGATAFSTRGDLGLQAIGGRGAPVVPPSVDPFGSAPSGYISGRGRGATGFAGGVSRDDTIDERDRGDYSEGNYDEFSGYSEALFKDSEYDEEDRQADDIYDNIEQRMDSRRRSRREHKLKEEIVKMRAEKPTIQQQLSDVKRSLASVSKEDWESIPSIGDYSLKQKQKKHQSVAPAPDSLLMSSRAYGLTSGVVQGGASTPIGLGLQTPLYGGYATPAGLQTPFGLQTPLGSATPSLNDLGEARGAVLSVKLDKVMDSISGQTVIDPKGYLTDLNSMQLRTDSDIADIKKARTLLKSVITTNPKHPPGWIAAARLEELAGKAQAARNLMAQGCLHCPTSEDIWLEAARFEKPVAAKSMLARAVKHIPHSVRLWLDACNREPHRDDKRRVLRKALEFIPNSVRLWKEAVSLEDEANARVLLTRAVECVPQSVDIWLALARLSNYADAQKVLNEARKNVPTSAEIWISACKLEETNGNAKMVDTIIKRAMENLTAKGATHQRDIWMKYAEEAESCGYTKTCQAIVKATMKVGVEEADMKRIWKEDAEEALSRNSIETAKAIYENALTFLKTKKSLWLALADLESKHGTPEALDAVLQRAVSFCPNAEVLWLMAAKQKWLQKDVPAARRILAEAFSHNENTEAISLAAVKLEKENDEFARARKLLERARIQCNTPKVWMQSVQLERQLGNIDSAVELLDEAFEHHNKFEKLWMIAGQVQLEKPVPDYEKAAQIYAKGIEVCPECIPLWLCAIDCQEKQKNWTQARVLIEKARLKNTKNENLWLATVLIEKAAGNIKMANYCMSKALQECPNSGILWAEAIFLEPLRGRNAKSVDALNKCENDANVILAVAKLFWESNKVIKARKWFNRAVTLNPSLGDAWGAFLAFELENGTKDEQVEIISRCVAESPNSGLNWNRIAKKVSNWRLGVDEKLKQYIKVYYPGCVNEEFLSIFDLYQKNVSNDATQQTSA